jgi:hypothetical protein
VQITFVFSKLHKPDIVSLSGMKITGIKITFAQEIQGFVERSVLSSSGCDCQKVPAVLCLEVDPGVRFNAICKTASSEQLLFLETDSSQWSQLISGSATIEIPIRLLQTQLEEQQVARRAWNGISTAL